MRQRSVAIAAPVAVVLIALVALLVYDGSRGDTIAKGIRVGGVDVGGLSPAQARERLRRDYLGALRRPIVVHWDTKTWKLGPREAHIAANVDQMVDDAVARSDRGNLFSRSWRRLTGGSIDADLRPSVTYSDAAIVRLLDRVRKDVDRRPVDASISFAASGITRKPDRTGLQVDASRLHRRIRAAITSPNAQRTFVAHTRKVQPKVTDKNLAKTYATVLIVDRADFQLKLYKDLRLAKTYDIAVGMQGLETPAGLYHIQNKAVDPAWNVPNSDWAGKLAGQVIPGGAPNNPLKARWLGIFDGAGIHGIDPSEYGSIGHAASHGCVRMRIPDVIDLYPRVPVGAPIYIA
jgi:lipoprotein-anchoring transpeptidase ErfK/SrfK